MVEEVGIGNPVDCRIHSNGEAKHGCDVFEAVFGQFNPLNRQHCNLPSCDSRDHGAACHGLDKKDKRHYG